MSQWCISLRRLPSSTYISKPKDKGVEPQYSLFYGHSVLLLDAKAHHLFVGSRSTSCQNKTQSHTVTILLETVSCKWKKLQCTKKKSENLERFPAVCGRLPVPRTGRVWCESLRSGCTPDAELSPAWLTEWTAACPSLFPHSGTFPNPESKEHIKQLVRSKVRITPEGVGALVSEVLSPYEV